MSQEDVEMSTAKCQSKKHVQQVAFSTYHHALTQVCFTCNKVRTSMEEKDIIKNETKK